MILSVQGGSFRRREGQQQSAHQRNRYAFSQEKYRRAWIGRGIGVGRIDSTATRSADETNSR